MDNTEIIKSFESQDELNPKIWEKDGNSYTMKPEVREKLLEIANLFIDFLGVDVIVTDIIMIGSLVNYNWSKYSDIDLHIVVNFNQFSENSKDLYLEFFEKQASHTKAPCLHFQYNLHNQIFALQNIYFQNPSKINLDLKV